MVHVQEKHSELISFADIFGAAHGPDFFSEVLTRTRDWSGASAAALSKVNVSMQFEVAATTNDQLNLNNDTISKIHSEQSDAALLVLDSSEMQAVCNAGCGQGVLLYFNDTYGQVIGCLILLFEQKDPREVELSVLRNVCHRIAQEIERQDAEEMLLEASEETALYSGALKDMHELGSFRYKTQDELYEKYLRTSFAVLGVQSGFLIKCGDRPEILFNVDVESPEQYLAMAAKTTQFLQETATGDNGVAVGSVYIFPFHSGDYCMVFWQAGESPEPLREFQIEVIELMLTNLAHEIIRREADAQIRALKIKQDGDYFLTSLLIKPLVGDHLESITLESDMLLKQKKEFVFKNNRYELGGDYAITQNVTIHGKEYGFFMNADAMGKSMQGAGGALVLGAVVDAILKRTARLISFADQYPERWLKVVYDEIQSTFESFDGSMLVSLVMGLVDLELGVVYYLNAEHPWIVLYRDGSASFLETDFHLRKIGFMGATDLFSIRVFRMEKNDVLFIGSDGRDDLELAGQDQVINYDESLFLEVVEATDGKMDGLIDDLNKRGRLTDDYSMLRLGFMSPGPKQSPEIKDAMDDPEKINGLIIDYGYLAPNVTYDFVKNMSKRKDFKEALTLLEYLVEYHPELDRAVYLNSHYAKLCGKYMEAVDLGERVNLRDPLNECNLINLANLYVLINNLDRAEQLLARLPESGPDYRYFTQVKDVREAIQRRRK